MLKFKSTESSVEPRFWPHDVAVLPQYISKKKNTQNPIVTPGRRRTIREAAGLEQRTTFKILHNTIFYFDQLRTGDGVF